MEDYVYECDPDPVCGLFGLDMLVFWLATYAFLVSLPDYDCSCDE